MDAPYGILGDYKQEKQRQWKNVNEGKYQPAMHLLIQWKSRQEKIVVKEMKCMEKENKEE